MRAPIALLALVVACKSGGDKPADKPPPDPGPEAAPQPATPAPDAASLKQHMQGHFTAIREIERALVDGDLAKAKERAGWLAAHEPHDATAGWQPHMDAVRTAARALTGAADLAGATELAANLGGECASCHVTTTAIVSFPHEDLPPAGTDNRMAMRRHQWAADRMWEGLIGPSQTAWVQGAEILAAAPFVPKTSLGQAERDQVAALAKQVHELGASAADLELEVRAAHYAKLLRTCSGCHAIARPR